MKVQLKEVNCTNIEMLKEEIKKLWVTRMTDSQYLRNLVESMPRCLQEVIAREGGLTKY